MAIVINGSGTVTGLSVGGLPDGTVDADTLASGAGGVSGVTSSADATAISIDSSERVGIGAATSPNTLMHIKAASGSVLRVEETGGSYIDIEAGGSTGHIKSKTGNDLTFSTGSTQQLKITSGGRGLSQFTAKAWVNWDGTNTPGLKDSHNVSSVTDNGTGNFTIALSTNMANTNYSVTSMSTRSGGSADDVMVNGINGNLRTNGADFHVVRTRGDGAGANSYWDVNTNCAHFFGD